jgi:hypothetical protein
MKEDKTQTIDKVASEIIPSIKNIQNIRSEYK